MQESAKKDWNFLVIFWSSIAFLIIFFSSVCKFGD